MQELTICVQLGNPLHPGEGASAEKLEALVEEQVSLCLQTRFECVIVQYVQLGPCSPVKDAVSVPRGHHQ